MAFPSTVRNDAEAGHETGPARNLLIAIAVASIAILWLSPFAFFAVAYLVPPPTPGANGLAYAKFYSVPVPPGGGHRLDRALRACVSELYYKPSRFFVIAAFWAAVAGWWLSLFVLLR